MSQDFEWAKGFTAIEAINRETARIERERAAWQRAMPETAIAVQRWQELTQTGLPHSQAAKQFTELRSVAPLIEQQARAIGGSVSPAVRAFKAWEDSQREVQARVRKMLEPLAAIRENVLINGDFSKRLRSTAALSDAPSIGQLAKMWSERLQGAQALARRVDESLGVGDAIGKQLKEFARINKQWEVPPELIDMVSPLMELQNQIGKVTLPTIDWGAAVALGKLLGQEGLDAQLSHLGIEPDGSMRELVAVPEKGLLSRRQSDAVALISLLLALIGIWIALQTPSHQEHTGAVCPAENNEQMVRRERQFESLSRLAEKMLEQSSKAQEERFVVRGRVATVRSSPRHGSSVEGKLMPNEVVRAVGKNGKWMEVEYYHWLNEEYRTGWILKKYLERVPANYSHSDSD